jgi:hypothetical protein
MGQTPQEPALDEAKQQTRKGLEIPVPKRKEVLDAFRRIVGAQPKKPLAVRSAAVWINSWNMRVPSLLRL